MFEFKRQHGPIPSYPEVIKYRHPNKDFIVISGSCSVESEEQVHRMAKIVSDLGATHLRGGIYRAGTYPKNGAHFGWLSEDVIREYKIAAARNGLKNIIEVLDYSSGALDMINEYCDVFQVGARSQQNYALLRKLGKYNKPVFLKRNTGCTVDELLGSAEHLLLGGVKEIHLIERGSSTFHNDIRWAPCVHTIPSIQSICDIPVIMDASHSTGRRDLVPAVTLAGVAAGADGILVEVHEDPDKSLSDPDQAIDPVTFEKLMTKVGRVRQIVKEI